MTISCDASYIAIIFLNLRITLRYELWFLFYLFFQESITILWKFFVDSKSKSGCLEGIIYYQGLLTLIIDKIAWRYHCVKNNGKRFNTINYIFETFYFQVKKMWVRNSASCIIIKMYCFRGIKPVVVTYLYALKRLGEFRLSFFRISDKCKYIS